MTSPVREQTDIVRTAFIAEGYTATRDPTRAHLESCHSSRVEMHGVPCVETYVAVTPGAATYTAPVSFLNRLAEMSLRAWRHGTSDEMLKALGCASHVQLVERVDHCKYRLLLPTLDAELPERPWEPTSTTGVRAKNGTIIVAEALAGWTIVGQHATRMHRGKPQTFRARIRRCGCASINGRPEPRLCSCVLKFKPVSRFDERAHSPGSGFCHSRGHQEAINAFVDHLAKAYA